MTKYYNEKVMQAYESGLINEYMADRISKALGSDGLTDDITECLLDDAQYASDMGVKDDNDYNVYFYVIRLTDDILDDTFGIKLENGHKKDLCNYILSNRNDDYKLDNLTDYRLLIHKWLCDSLSKKAYPNIEGKNNKEPVYNVDKWIETLKNIYASLHNKKADRQSAINYFTDGWEEDEKFKFINWMRYYEEGTTEKYNVKIAKLTKQALEQEITELSLPQSWMSREDRAADHVYMSTQKKKEQTAREKELQNAKQYKAKMRARLRSFKRLLEKYNDILPKQDLENIYDELYSLEKNISKLDVYASLQDCTIRSANRINKFGFPEGAAFLHKVAQEPMEAEPAPTPATSPNVQTAINRLEEISKALKSRDMIRELASIDILLNDIGIASYFPELTDAQSKLIEAFGYASNKVENIVAKLRGSGTSTKSDVTAPELPVAQLPQSPAPPPPAPPAPVKNIDTGGLMEKPVGEVKKTLPTE